MKEGYIEVTGGRVWYRMAGASKERRPLVVLHGGPGFPSDYLKPLDPLADERPVIFYDQLGCGNSDKPEDRDLWRVERFVLELEEVVTALELEEFYLLGHSWGSMLATDYLLKYPKRIKGLIFASPAISVEKWMEDAYRLRSTLPKDIQELLKEHEEAGSTDSEEYKSATMLYIRNFVCRMDSIPQYLEDSLGKMGKEVYETMWGPSEFFVTGRLKDYDRSSYLKDIRLPTLFICGRYDEATPETTAWYQSLVPGAKLSVVEDSSHMSMLEKAEDYIKAIREFLREADSAKG